MAAVREKAAAARARGAAAKGSVVAAIVSNI